MGCILHKEPRTHAELMLVLSDQFDTFLHIFFDIVYNNMHNIVREWNKPICYYENFIDLALLPYGPITWYIKTRQHRIVQLLVDMKAYMHRLTRDEQHSVNCAFRRKLKRKLEFELNRFFLSTNAKIFLKMISSHINVDTIEFLEFRHANLIEDGPEEYMQKYRIPRSTLFNC